MGDRPLLKISYSRISTRYLHRFSEGIDTAIAGDGAAAVPGSSVEIASRSFWRSLSSSARPRLQQTKCCEVNRKVLVKELQSTGL